MTTSGTTINRFCSSGLQAIAVAAQQIMTEGSPVMIGSGVESISLVQMGGMNTKNITEEHLMQVKPELWISMIETAEIVAERYGVSRATARTNTRSKASGAPPPRSRPANSRMRSFRWPSK